MSNLVIVAIPDENDRVWKVSSEEIPHLTVLFLGDPDEVSNLDTITQFVEHAATTTLSRFYLPVDRRGELGEDPELGPADVLFFKKGRYDYKAIRDFRAALLKDNNIRTAHDAAQQHDGPWLPHLTLGYANRPAKPVEDDYPFYDVSFNKIAVWIDNYNGPDFLLKDFWDEWDALETVPMDVAMSSISGAEDAMRHSADLGAEFLAHHGVKGMKWGVRKEDLGSGAKTVGKVLARGADNTLFEVGKTSPWVNSSIVSAAHDKLKADLPSIKAKHGDYGKLANRAKKPLSKEARAYRKDVKAAYLAHLESSANSITNVSGSRRYTIKEHGKPNGSRYYWNVSTESTSAKHAVTEPASIKVRPVIEDGWIIDLEIMPDEMAQSDDRGSQFILEHFGVKGMHWGTRKAPPEAVAPSANSVVPHGTKRQTKLQVEGGENHPAHEDAVVVAKAQIKLKKSGPAALSNKELRDVANRIELEQRVKMLSTGGGKRFVSGLLKNQGQQSAGRVITKKLAKQGL